MQSRYLGMKQTKSLFLAEELRQQQKKILCTTYFPTALSVLFVSMEGNINLTEPGVTQKFERTKAPES